MRTSGLVIRFTLAKGDLKYGALGTYSYEATIVHMYIQYIQYCVTTFGNNFWF